MKSIKLISLIVICTLFIGCKSYQDILVSGVDDFHLNKMTSTGIDADIKLKIKNPNSVGFSIYPSAFNIMYGGINLGKAKMSKRVKINKNSEAAYSFNLNSNFKDLNPLDLLQLLNGKSAGTVDVTGNLKVGKFLIRKKIPINHHQKVNMFK